MAGCKHKGSTSTHTTTQQIGREMVTWRDTLCNDCGAVLKRDIISRRPA